MVQAPGLWNSDHTAERNRLDGAGDRCVLFQRQMRPTTLVVFEVALQNSTQPSLMEDNDVIQAFAPNGANQPFDIGILPRTLGRSRTS